MCRLLLGSKGAIRKYDRQHGLLQLLDHLEQEMGGHGNGVVFVKDKRILQGNKGVLLGTQEIAMMEAELDYDWMIFHTRLVSVGAQTDEQCHPYWERNDALAMNGTEYDFADLAGAIGTTDSEVIFRIIRGMKPQQAVEVLGHLSSVFVGVIDGVPIASNSTYGDLCRWGKRLFASSFPKGVKCTNMGPNGWVNGQLVKREEEDPWRGYGRYSRGYGWDYDLGYDEGKVVGYAKGYGEGYSDGGMGLPFDTKQRWKAA